MTDLDFLKDVEEDEVTLPNENKLGRLTALARTQLSIQDEIEQLQIKLKQRQEAHDKISEHEIPSLMQEIGAREIVLLDGRKLKIAPFYSGKITGPECYEWLGSNGFGDIVKTDIVVQFRMSDEEKAMKVRKLLHDNNVDWNENSGVHHSTLKAFIKDQVQTGKPIDRDLFAVYVGWRTVIK